MGSFIATNPEDSAQQTLANLTFFPSIEEKDFRDIYRVDDGIKSVRVINALTMAMIDINDELSTYRTEKEEAGIQKLEDVEAPQYGEGDNAKSVLIHHYITAIFSRAKAHLLEVYRDYDTTNAGEVKAEKLEEQIGDYLAVARASIRSIIGVSRSTVELI